ncbi:MULTISPECIES: hypothetical protein [Eisenbergiella]|uniref:Uncharacterized protein n=1 Tax=Eisenbergiella porci TaxID=2652274 RepID=A0A6N7VYE2_9FIRM|nr:MULTISPECIES: hypothetical protein [Eisenbergiella]MDY2654365.1 hypothetical protein [Eisenbergiella porci]MSS88046.1 hypothetical protein [Eisenbergiella porci]
MEKQEFQERAELLREKFRKAGRLAAMGVSWAEEGKTLQEAVDEAENLMYQEKKVFIPPYISRKFQAATSK